MNRDYDIGSVAIATIVVFGIGFLAGYYTKYEIQEKESINSIGEQEINKEIPKAGATLQWVQDNPKSQTALPIAEIPECGGKLNGREACIETLEGRDPWGEHTAYLGEITPVKESSKLWYINDKGISVRLPPVDELQFLEPEVGTVYCYEYLGDDKYDLMGIR